MHINEVAFSILQNQSHSTPFQIVGGRPEMTIKDWCIEHCRSDIEQCHSFLSHWPFEACLWRHLYIAIQPLTLMLDDTQNGQLFTAACTMMRSGYSNFRLCGHLLQATLAFANVIGTTLPQEALPHFAGCRERLETRNLPLSFALPRQNDTTVPLKERLSLKSPNSLAEHDLGTLIETMDLQ
jgi:hypothetical protein